MDYRQAIDLLNSLVDRERTGPVGPRQRVIPANICLRLGVAASKFTPAARACWSCPVMW